jgi:TonB family protein
MSHRIRLAWIPAFVIAASSILEAQQPRDPRPDVPRPASAREGQLRAALESDPTAIASWLELAKLQEQRGAVDDAEASLKRAAIQSNNARNVLVALSQFYNRAGQFEKTVETLQLAADAAPTDPAGHQLVATYYWEKAHKDQTLSPEDKARYIDAGISATDRAIALNADYVEALTYKNILLRMKANLQPDAVQKDALLQEADSLKNRAMELQKARAGQPAVIGAPAPPPPPPPPGVDAAAGGMAPVRVGGNIKTPTKLKDVRPTYPPDAFAAGIAGMVIIEAVIGTEGSVESARVLRSIPALDDAALEAVRQWKFTPTLLNGAPVPVIMTVTVNFTIDR